MINPLPRYQRRGRAEYTGIRHITYIFGIQKISLGKALLANSSSIHASLYFRSVAMRCTTVPARARGTYYSEHPVHVGQMFCTIYYLCYAIT